MTFCHTSAARKTEILPKASVGKKIADAGEKMEEMRRNGEGRRLLLESSSFVTAFCRLTVNIAYFCGAQTKSWRT